MTRYSWDLFAETANGEDDQRALFPVVEDKDQLELFVLEQTCPDINFSDPVDPEYRHRLLRAWTVLHPTFASTLNRRGIKVHAPVTMREYRGRILNNHLSSGALYSSRIKTVIVPQLWEWAMGIFVPTLQPASYLYHELGHAIDGMLGIQSRKAGFILAFDQDRAQIGSATPESKYFWNPLSGADEAFAEIWAQQALKGRSEAENSYDPLFEQHFPHSWAWIAANVPSAQNGFSLPRETINLPDEAGATPFDNLAGELDAEELHWLLEAGLDPLTPKTSGKSVIDHYIACHEPVMVGNTLLFLARIVAREEALADGWPELVGAGLPRWSNFLSHAEGGDHELFLAALEILKEV